MPLDLPANGRPGTSGFCWIEESAGFVTFTPLRNGGSRGDEKGFQPFGKEPVRVPASFSNEELGDVLLQTLSHCE